MSHEDMTSSDTFSKAHRFRNFVSDQKNTTGQWCWRQTLIFYQRIEQDIANLGGIRDANSYMT